MFKITVLLSCFCATAILAMPALDESAAKQFIIESSDKFSELYKDMVKTIFDISDIGDDDDDSDEKTKASSENAISISDSEWSTDEITGFFAVFLILAKIGKLKEATDNITTLADEAYRFPIDQFKDEEVKLGIMKLKTTPGLLALGKTYDDWFEDDFDDLIAIKNVCKYKKPEGNCDKGYDEVINVLKTSTDPDEILFYWNEWRTKMAKTAPEKLNVLIELFKKLGEKYKESGKFAWFSDYLDENFDVEMEKVVHGLEPLFKELHAYVRYMLHQQYGDKVPKTGLIPNHFYEQAMVQAWVPESVIAKDFKGVKMPIENNFKQTPKEVVEISKNFMKSLGMSEIPENFWTENVKGKGDKDDDCSADLYDSGNNTYFIYCNEVNIKKFLQMHGYVSRIYYANERKDLPFAYLDNYNMELAAGEAVILSAGTPKYLHAIGQKDVSVLPENEDMNRLYRLGVHTILSVPEYFVHVKVISDILDGKVVNKDINKHYWDLMAKYVGVAPPLERTPESFDFPYKFYKNIHLNQQSNKFISEVIGYQIYDTLCKKSGEYIKGDKTLQLHKCNFYNSKEAGTVLKDMMHLGGKKPWKQILGSVTGDFTGMKAEPMLEFYEPLKKWLHTKNSENGVTVGW